MKVFLINISLLVSFGVFAQEKPVKTDFIKPVLTVEDSLVEAGFMKPIGADSVFIKYDNPIVANLDKLLFSQQFETYQPEYDMEVLNTFGYEKDEVPEFSDSIYKQRLRYLDSQTPFNLVYNDEVAAWIRLYVYKRRKYLSRLLGLSHTYYPLFEETLDRYDLPLEFKHLAIVESALNPKARSRAGAVGLWQFIYSTGKMFDLEVTSYIDERMDPYKETVAACEYFTYLYNIYNNWELVLAAYNCGPGNVNRAIRKANGGTDYWDLWPYLPKETRGYVPAFIAVNYTMNFAGAHNIYPVPPKTIYSDFDTIRVCQQITFEQLTSIIDVPIEDLEYLNPSYKRNVIPVFEEPALVCIPKEKIGLFMQNEETIYACAPSPEDSTSTLSSNSELVRKTHIVRSGEYLGSIANRYKCSVRDVQDWNGMRTTRLMPGQRLTVYVDKKKTPQGMATKTTVTASSSKPKSTSSSFPKTGNYKYYTIQNGDTLWDIAKTKNISVDNLKQWNSHLNFNNMKPGTRIIVGSS